MKTNWKNLLCTLKILFFCGCALASDPVENEVVQFRNPLFCGGGDPWFFVHEGKYCYCYSVNDGIAVQKAGSFTDFHAPDRKDPLIWKAPGNTRWSKQIWAPEMFLVNGTWYVYFAADDGDNKNHRMYVLRGKTTDPQGQFEFVGQLTDPTDKWAIDGTFFQWKGKMYTIWSGWEGDQNVAQDLYIAELETPVRIKGNRVRISRPELAWEMHGNPLINEGPEILQHDGRIFLVYSASGSWTAHYCLGVLEFNGTDPMDPAAWKKYPRPILQSGNGVVGPGHCSFFHEIRTGRLMCAYHANPPEKPGWNGRHIMVDEVEWTVDGIPMVKGPSGFDAEVILKKSGK